jgi:predicted ATPase
MNERCGCDLAHEPRFVVVTGGPGAGKTALLEVVRQHFCQHVVVLPEAASILFSGGFPRRASAPARRAAQRAIFHVERELERLASEERRAAVVLCDRGTLDGLAYWPSAREDFFSELGTSFEAELARYAAVIHLRTPDGADGYNHQNPVRTESAGEAATIDERILEVWSRHPRRHVVESAPAFMEKVGRALEVLSREIPACCASNELAPAGSPALRAPGAASA